MDLENKKGDYADVYIGPYKATRLWNDVVSTFRQGVPCGRHRRYMRAAENCFVGSAAVDWLLNHLRHNINFGPDVTRKQTVQLLNKFYKAGIFEEVQVSRRGRNKQDFSDSNRLYRLLPPSPSKSTRAPLVTGPSTNVQSSVTQSEAKGTKKDEEGHSYDADIEIHKKRNNSRESVREKPYKLGAPAKSPLDSLPQCHLVGRILTLPEIGEVWKTAALSRLKKILGENDLNEVLQGYKVDGINVRHNCIFNNKNGVVTNIPPEDQLPHWVMSAMKCLARWPEKVEGDLPSYPGFEKDVFGVVRDYFLGLPEPLISYNLYDVITNVFVQVGNQIPRHSSPYASASADQNHLTHSLWSSSSLENIILDLARKYCMRADSRIDLADMAHSQAEQSHPSRGDSDWSHCRTSFPGGRLGPSNFNESRKFRSTPDLQVTHYETAFGPENQTVTRVYYSHGVSSDFHHGSSKRDLSAPVETHFDVATGCGDSQNHRTSFERFDVPGNASSGCTETLRAATGRGNLQTGVCRQETDVPSISPHAASHVSQNFFPGKTRTIGPAHRRTRAERHKTFGGSQFDFKEGEEVQRGMNAAARQLSASTPFLPTIGENDSQGPNLVTIRSKLPGWRSDQKSSSSKKTTSLFVRFPQSSLCEERVTKALQVVCLFLPPASRRKLQFLLKLLSKMAANSLLVLDHDQSTRSLVLGTFQKAVLCSPEEPDLDEVLVLQLLSFMVDHHAHILAVPQDMKDAVEDRLRALEKPQIVYSPRDPGSLRFCRPTTVEQYETTKQEYSRQALFSLLDTIVRDQNMSEKEKKRRLKQFQRSHPDIYKQRFPSEESANPPEHQPKIKPPLLSKPLLRLKGLRI
ncbi:DEP domain-containing protein 1B-like isoform X2 [Pomacea canaliculata]|uniref:DEP domain-containing protein 1B-like isoform X2 n=1 Tax=Pomacea canaliculata TaxID=400727 RepID=UPI000D72D281|nr:DEP domain-containing protein 1B-like isoform X2 [Pomacea canaliculata]